MPLDQVEPLGLVTAVSETWSVCYPHQKLSFPSPAAVERPSSAELCYNWFCWRKHHYSLLIRPTFGWQEQFGMSTWSVALDRVSLSGFSLRCPYCSQFKRSSTKSSCPLWRESILSAAVHPGNLTTNYPKFHCAACVLCAIIAKWCMVWTWIIRFNKSSYIINYQRLV